MPVRKVSVVFDLDVELFTRILGAANQGVRFETYGDDKPFQVEGPKRQLALPAPKEGARHLILAHMKQHPDKTFTTDELVVFVENYGYERKNVHNAMHNMHRDGLIRKYRPGQYRVSKAGMQHG